MNAKKLIAAVAVFAAAGSVFAQGSSEFTDFVNVPSTKSRAEVKAELAQARTEGQLARSEYVEFTNVASTTPRASLPVARNAGLENRKEYVEFVNVVSTRSREDVRNEARQAARGDRSNIDG